MKRKKYIVTMKERNGNQKEVAEFYATDMMELGKHTQFDDLPGRGGRRSFLTDDIESIIS